MFILRAQLAIRQTFNYLAIYTISCISQLQGADYYRRHVDDAFQAISIAAFHAKYAISLTRDCFARAASRGE